LAARYPERLQELKDLWWAQAREYGVLPLDGRSPLDSVRSELPRQLLSRPLKYTYYPGIQHVPHEASPMLVTCGYTITAQVDRADTKAEGVLFAYGGGSGGVVFYIRDNKLAFEHNTFGTHNALISPDGLPPGPAELRYEYMPTGATTGTGALFVNGKLAATASYTFPSALFYAWEGVDIGRDALSHVSEAYADKGDFEFPEGALHKVDLEIKIPPSMAKAMEQSAAAGGASDGSH
jgi:hypothetical protein